MKKGCIFVEPKIRKERLLLHVCCAPCSSYVMELLAEEYDITLYFYNPNITEESEYKKRYIELQRFLQEAPFTVGITALDGGYSPTPFFEMSKGLEDEPERGSRCYRCYELRMEETARFAEENGFDVFTTTLSISPHKNAKWINEIGERLKNTYQIGYLYSDFKKKNGYARSIELSKEYHLYRQDYCGCVFSKKEKQQKNNNSLV